MINPDFSVENLINIIKRDEKEKDSSKLIFLALYKEYQILVLIVAGFSVVILLLIIA